MDQTPLVGELLEFTRACFHAGTGMCPRGINNVRSAGPDFGHFRALIVSAGR
jgi:hypothetical protein